MFRRSTLLFCHVRTQSTGAISEVERNRDEVTMFSGALIVNLDLSFHNYENSIPMIYVTKSEVFCCNSSNGLRHSLTTWKAFTDFYIVFFKNLSQRETQMYFTFMKYFYFKLMIASQLIVYLMILE